MNGVPYSTLEAQGAVIGKDFVMIGGFANGIKAATTKTYSLDTSDPNADWQKMDDLPISQGVTHGAFVVVGQKFYMCGGVRRHAVHVLFLGSPFFVGWNRPLTRLSNLFLCILFCSTWVDILAQPLLIVWCMTTPSSPGQDSGVRSLRSPRIARAAE